MQSLAHYTIQADFPLSISTKSTFWLSTYKTGHKSHHATVSATPTVHSSLVLLSSDAHVSASVSDARANRLVVSAAFDADAREAPVLVAGQDVSLPFGAHISCLAFSPSGTHLVVGGDNGAVKVFGVGDWEPTLPEFKGHVGDISTAKFFPSSTVLLTSATDLQLRIWDAPTGSCAVTIGPANGGHTRPITSTGIIARGRNILTASTDGRVLLWEVKSSSVICEVHDGVDAVTALCVGVTADALVAKLEGGRKDAKLDEREVETVDKVCFVGTEKGDFVGYDLGSKKSFLTVKSTSTGGGITAIAYDAESGFVATGSSTGAIQLFDLRNPTTPLSTLKRNDASILNLEFISVGTDASQVNLLFTNAEGSCAHVSVPTSGTPARVVTEYVGTDVEPLYGLSVSADWIATGGRDGVHQMPESDLSNFKTSLGSHYDPALHPDPLLSRFLRARQNNIPAATKMFTNWQEWYATTDVEDIIQNFAYPEHATVHKVYPRFFHKTDKTGQPIMFQQHHSLDAQALYTATTHDRMVAHLIRENEKLAKYRLPACSASENTLIEKCVLIFDLKNAPMMQFNKARQWIATMSQISSDYHPETLGRVFLINAPFGFSTAWYIIQNLISPETAAKVKICGSNFIPTLLEFIPAENLPRQYGGTCECEGGCENQDVGPWNDGSVVGYPDAFWEGFRKRDEDAALELEGKGSIHGH
ncbi:cytosolic factor, phosphatidylinositol/phosphatidylcholine transfer protein [Podochytrium sp. JEL0797]|nr:cytosolic factor, phosphatidylinositol/phosphatidylcholine transfer protein [Podochytrium sp. JEL0797]